MKLSSILSLVLVLQLVPSVGLAIPSTAPCKPDKPWTLSSKGPCDIVFIGDDATQGWTEKGKGLEVWAKSFAEGPHKAINCGMAGDRTEHVLWRLDQGQLDGVSPKVVVLMIGTANTVRRSRLEEPPLDTILGIQAILRNLRRRYPSVKVILHPIPPASATATDERRIRSDTINAVLRKLADGKNVLWCDFNKRLVPQKFTRPNYEAWAKALPPYLDFALGRSQKAPKRAAPPMETALPIGHATTNAEVAIYWLNNANPKVERRLLKKREEICAAKNRVYDAIWIGDSITHFWEKGGKQTFAETFGREYRILNLGFGGDKTQNTLWNIRCGGFLDHVEARIVTLMIGTNNIWKDSPEDIAAGVRACLDAIHEKLPKAKILLFAVLPREVAHKRGDRDFRRKRGNVDEVMPNIAKVNKLIRPFADGKDVLFVDLTEKFIDAEGLPDITLLGDGTHPCEAGYRVWANEVMPIYRRIIATPGAIKLSFDKPLASGHLNFCDNLRRFDVPLERPMDLSSANGVEFELKCQDPAVIENVWLLMKSGAGYYRAAAAKPAKAGVWTRTVVAKADVRLYHWDAHMSLWEKVERPDEKDLPDWSRVEGFQVVVAIDIDATSKDASVAARAFKPVAKPVPPHAPVPPSKRIAAQPGERRLICTHVWGVDHDWDKTCRELAPYGITDISPLISHGGHAYYKTRFGVEHPLVAKYGDALRLSVAACHKYGMKCHPRRSCWSLGFHAAAETLAAFRKEGRLQVGFDGKDGAWLCPTHEANLRREVEGMLELAEAGADGIMIDFFRYPNADFCFCPRCRARFEKRLGRTVEPWPQAVRSDAAIAAEWSRFRCDVMSEAFNEVARQVKAVAPRLELSAAVAATVKGAEDRGQDWPRWCRDGGLDVLYPMCYYSTGKMLKRDLVGLSAAVAGTRTKLVPMICFASGDIPFVEPDEFARQIDVLRAAGIRDRAFFRLQEYAPTCLKAVFSPAK